jgi:hypothetical protein
MHLRVSTRCMAYHNFHPPDEQPFNANSTRFRFPYAVPGNARNVSVPRFNCQHQQDNILTNIAAHTLPDQNGYVVTFSSYDDLPADEGDNHNPAELQCIAYKYYSRNEAPANRYIASPLRSETILRAIKFFDGSYVPGGQNITPESLLQDYLVKLDAKLPKSAKLEETIPFVKEFMNSLLGGQDPCWERERMEIFLNRFESDELDLKDDCIMRFVARWIANNLSHLTKIISHKTDGAHRDFAYESLLTGSFGNNSDLNKSVMNSYFLTTPHPAINVSVQFTIPETFDENLLQNQKRCSREKQNMDGKDKGLDAMDVLSDVLRLVQHDSPEPFLSNRSIKGVVNSGLTSKEQFINDYVPLWGLSNNGDIEQKVNSITDDAWKKNHRDFLGHFYILDRARKILKVIAELPDSLKKKLQDLGFGNVKELLDGEENLQNVMNILLLPPAGGACRGVCSWLGLVLGNGVSLKELNLATLLGRNEKLFTDPSSARIIRFFTNPGNHIKYWHIDRHKVETEKSGLPALFVAGFLLLLFSFISKEASSEVRNFLGKVIPFDQQYSDQKTAGSVEKVSGYLVLSVAKVYENFHTLSGSLDLTYRAVNLRGAGGAVTRAITNKKDFPANSFYSCLMSNAIVGTLRDSRSRGVDPVIEPHDRDTLLSLIGRSKCCADANNCDCPCRTFGTTPILQSIAQSIRYLTDTSSRNEFGDEKLLKSVNDDSNNSSGFLKFMENAMCGNDEALQQFSMKISKNRASFINRNESTFEPDSKVKATILSRLGIVSDESSWAAGDDEGDEGDEEDEGADGAQKTKRSRNKKSSEDAPTGRKQKKVRRSRRKPNLCAERLYQFISICHAIELLPDIVDHDSDLKSCYEKNIKPLMVSNCCVFDGCNNERNGKDLFINRTALPLCNLHFQLMRRLDLNRILLEEIFSDYDYSNSSNDSSDDSDVNRGSEGSGRQLRMADDDSGKDSEDSDLSGKDSGREGEQTTKVLSVKQHTGKQLQFFKGGKRCKVLEDSDSSGNDSGSEGEQTTKVSSVKQHTGKQLQFFKGGKQYKVVGQHHPDEEVEFDKEDNGDHDNGDHDDDNYPINNLGKGLGDVQGGGEQLHAHHGKEESASSGATIGVSSLLRKSESFDQFLEAIDMSVEVPNYFEQAPLTEVEGSSEVERLLSPALPSPPPPPPPPSNLRDDFNAVAEVGENRCLMCRNPHAHQCNECQSKVCGDHFVNLQYLRSWELDIRENWGDGICVDCLNHVQITVPKP